MLIHYSTGMQNKFLIFVILILSACSMASKDEKENQTFSGTWFLNKSGDNYDGKMVISDCTDKQCKFKLYSSQYGHTCDVDGIMKIYDKTHATYTKRFNNGVIDFISEIRFTHTANNTINIHYGNINSWNIFCGMNATIEGDWTKS